MTKLAGLNFKSVRQYEQKDGFHRFLEALIMHADRGMQTLKGWVLQ